MSTITLPLLLQHDHSSSPEVRALDIRADRVRFRDLILWRSFDILGDSMQEGNDNSAQPY